MMNPYHCAILGTCVKNKNLQCIITKQMYSFLATENKFTRIILDCSPRHVERLAPSLKTENVTVKMHSGNTEISGTG
jgi:hypothetical protein